MLSVGASSAASTLNVVACCAMRFRLSLLLLLLCGCAIGAEDRARREYQIQPGSLFLFEESPTLSPCDPIPAPSGKGPVAYLDAAGNVFVLHRKDQLSLARTEVSGLTLHPAFSSVAISGGQRDAYSIDLCAAAGEIDRPDAQQVLDGIRLSRSGDTLTLTAPSYDPERPSRSELRIAAPRDLPLSVDGSFSAVEIMDMAAPVKVRTTHARIKIMRTSGSVDAEADEFGVIDFAGERGEVRLNSANEINLKLTATKFNGSLHALAGEPVRVILPDAFSTPFEAAVRKASDFICRAPLCSQIKHSRREGGEWFSFGSATAALRFVSTNGPVVIDSLEQLRAAREQQKRETDEEAAERNLQTRHINNVAGSIHSEADAREYVNLLWKHFAPDVPKWIARSTLDRVARAEYAAVAGGEFIPEDRIANSFNNFVQRIGAPDWAHVTPEELHAIRAGELASAKATWNSYPNIWLMPNIYHVGSAGNLAPGCRAVEALKMLYTLNHLFSNAIYARERLRQNPVASHTVEARQSSPSSQEQLREYRVAFARAQEKEQELRRVEFEYVKQHGSKAYEAIVREMIDGVLP